MTWGSELPPIKPAASPPVRKFPSFVTFSMTFLSSASRSGVRGTNFTSPGRNKGTTVPVNPSLLTTALSSALHTWKTQSASEGIQGGSQQLHDMSSFIPFVHVGSARVHPPVKSVHQRNCVIHKANMSPQRHMNVCKLRLPCTSHRLKIQPDSAGLQHCL